MATDWRRLFTDLGVVWTDRGPNSRRGNVNVQCPLCTDDPSQHMQLSERGAGYFCLRNRRHSGTNTSWILMQVVPGLTRQRAGQLLIQYRLTGDAVQYHPDQPDTGTLARRWEFFTPAHHDVYYSYLRSRGFPDPRTVVDRYDLRYASYGQWAARILMPCVEHDAKYFMSWTGRVVNGTSTLRYLTEPSSAEGLLYIPRSIRANVVIVEGPMDALKVAVAMEDTPFSAISLMGRSLEPERLARVRRLIEHCTNVYTALDDDVPPSMHGELAASLASFGKAMYISRLRLPGSAHDPGEMPLNSIASWLSDAPRGTVRGPRVSRAAPHPPLDP